MERMSLLQCFGRGVKGRNCMGKTDVVREIGVRKKTDKVGVGKRKEGWEGLCRVC